MIFNAKWVKLITMTTPNIYQKLNTLREKVHGKIGKDGKNTFAKYNYFRLDDILNAVAPIMVEIGLIDTTPNFTWDAERSLFVLRATLVNTDDPTDVITSEFEILHDNIKGQTGQQASGSTNTYARRYVWQQWLALTEPNSDPDELNTGRQQQQQKLPVPVITLADVKVLAQAAYGDTYDVAKLALWASGNRVSTFDELNDAERTKLGKSLERKASGE